MDRKCVSELEAAEEIDVDKFKTLFGSNLKPVIQPPCVGRDVLEKQSTYCIHTCRKKLT
jgi:hypothetical protein